MAKVFNIGIVGFGKRSKDGLCKSMRNYGAIEGNDSFRVIAIADIRPEQELCAGLEEIGFGDARIYKTPEEMYENEINGYVYVGYNSQWGHYSLAWESESGDFVTEDDNSINHIVGGFKKPFNDVDWFVNKVATCLEDGTCRRGIRFVIENGEVTEEQYDY